VSPVPHSYIINSVIFILLLESFIFIWNRFLCLVIPLTGICGFWGCWWWYISMSGSVYSSLCPLRVPVPSFTSLICVVLTPWINLHLYSPDVTGSNIQINGHMRTWWRCDNETIYVVSHNRSVLYVLYILCTYNLTGLRPLAYWDCGFESRLGHGCLSLVSVVFCQGEVSATGWSLVQRSPTGCVVSKKCDREASEKEAA
jgi:hypothetical protein